MSGLHIMLGDLLLVSRLYAREDMERTSSCGLSMLITILTSAMRCVSLFLALLCNSALASTWNAPTGNLSDVQKTVNSAANGDTVTIPAGTFVWNNTLRIRKSLVIKGQGRNSTFILRHMGHAKD